MTTIISRFLLVSAFCLVCTKSFSQTMYTVAGGIGTTDTGTKVGLGNPYAIAYDTLGNAYIADGTYHVVRKLTPAGIVSTIAGTGAPGYTGNGGAATNACLNNPLGVATDRKGNIYVSEQVNAVVRKINPAGIITLFAGSDSAGYFGDYGSATNARLNAPRGIWVNDNGEVYIADYLNSRIRKVDTFGIITTIAGNGTASFTGDSGLATIASLKYPSAVTTDNAGNIYLCDEGNNRVRKINSLGIINTVVGNGTLSYNPDGTPATAAGIDGPSSVTIRQDGTLFYTDRYHFIVCYVDSNNLVRKYAGGGSHQPGDGLIADSVFIFRPTGIAFDRTGNLGIAVGDDKRVAIVNTARIFQTVGSNNTLCVAGDGGSATEAQVFSPHGVAVDLHGNIFISEYQNNIIRKVSNSGIITTFAGTGAQGFSGDGGPATVAKLYQPFGLATDKNGNLFFADMSNNRIRKIDTAGIITTVAGATGATYADEVAATTTSLSSPHNVYVDDYNNIFIADWGNDVIRKIDTMGIIHLVAGCFWHSFGGDGGPATAACINEPYGVCRDKIGNIYFSDANNHRIRKVNNGDTISTFAGNGTAGYSGDHGLATNAELYYPFDVKIDTDGLSVIFVDGYTHTVRKITPDNIITTIGGTGIAGFNGDHIAATASQLDNPFQVAIDPGGNVFITDGNNNRIRRIGDYVPTKVEEITKTGNDEILVFPNPASHELNIREAAGEQIRQICIFDIIGNLVYKNAECNSPMLTLQIDKMHSGIYILSVLTKNGYTTKRFEVLTH